MEIYHDANVEWLIGYLYQSKFAGVFVLRGNSRAALTEENLRNISDLDLVLHHHDTMSLLN
jgi:hypothetical protein